MPHHYARIAFDASMTYHSARCALALRAALLSCAALPSQLKPMMDEVTAMTMNHSPLVALHLAPILSTVGTY